MKKIYYFQKYEVKLGDIVEYNGIKTVVTEELIELNPELFSVGDYTQPMYFKCVKGECNYTKGRIYKQNYSTNYPIVISLTNDKGITENINYWEITYLKYACNCFELTTKEEWDKQELLDKAKKRYPIGTTFESWYQKDKYNTIPKNSTLRWESNVIIVVTDKFTLGMATLYKDGRWAEILPLKFTTEDGVNIYGDMKTYAVYKDDLDIGEPKTFGGNSSHYKYFYHKENALAYIEKHKEKTLKDYENMLLTINIDSINAREVCWFYRTLKGKEPKLYYAKILQLIADDLNNGRYIHISGDISYHLNNTRSVNVHCGDDEGCVYFKSRELVEKARDILGDKVKYLFN